MQKITFIIAVFFYSSVFAQKLTNTNIVKQSLDHISQEIYKDNKYSILDCKNLAEILAKSDIEKGIRRILSYMGPFTTGCEACLYYKYGYLTYGFAYADLSSESINAFVGAYNFLMERLLPIEARNEITNYSSYNRSIFSFHATTNFKYNCQRVNDSTLLFKMSSDTLEYLFKDDIKSLKISLSFNLEDSQKFDYSYNQLKTSGVILKDPGKEISKLYIVFNFKGIPANYSICWCPVLEPIYYVVLPLKRESISEIK